MPDWQTYYEHKLLKARRACEDARSNLAAIGAKERKEGAIDEMTRSLKSVEADISMLWEKHYGPNA